MHPNEELARREIELINAADMEAVEALYADDFVLHYPGRNPLSGTYTDLGEFISKLESLLAGGTLSRRLHDALGTDDHSVQLLTITADAQGHTHSWNAVIVMHVRGQQFTEAWFHVDDQYALDEFLKSLASGSE
jgi:uncharacterized protein